jgi:hypothetical protein
MPYAGYLEIEKVEIEKTSSVGTAQMRRSRDHLYY